MVVSGYMIGILYICVLSIRRKVTQWFNNNVCACALPSLRERLPTVVNGRTKV